MIFMGMSIGFGGVGVREGVGEVLGAFYKVGSYFFEFIIYWGFVRIKVDTLHTRLHIIYNTQTIRHINHRKVC